jgi:hypothetical protein
MYHTTPTYYENYFSKGHTKTLSSPMKPSLVLCALSQDKAKFSILNLTLYYCGTQILIYLDYRVGVNTIPSISG